MFFFFQAEDGIRDVAVTGVQTCALPICFHSLAALVARALTGRLDPAHVAAECAAQLARLREAGVRVTHIDSHRHVHVLPGVWGVVIETARRGGVPVVRVPLEPLSPRAASWRALLKQATLAAAWGVASRRSGAAQIGRASCRERV